MSEPCKHECEFAGTQRDTLTSFVKSNGELVKAQAERDEALAALVRVREAHHILTELYAKAAENADAFYRGSEDYADAFGQAADLILAALEPTDQPKGTKP